MGNNGYNMPGPGDEETWPPCTNHPNDPRTPAAEDFDVWEHPEFIERVKDLNGSMMEAITEATDVQLSVLSDLILDDEPLKIGLLIRMMIEEYCGKDLEAPEYDNGDDYDEDRAQELRDEIRSNEL